MKENICMKCGRRSCTFRSYDREDCPYEIKPPQLYEQDSESEERQETANSWQKRPPFLLKHFQIKEPALDFAALKITRQLMAEVVDMTDGLIVEAIKKEAARQGFTDLYLIDRELVKNVITGATTKRGHWYKDNFTKIIKCSCCRNDAPISTISGEQYEAEYCQSCGAKMDEEKEAEQ